MFINIDNAKVVNTSSIQMIVVNYERNIVEIYMSSPLNRVDVVPRYGESVTELFDNITCQLGELRNV